MYSVGAAAAYKTLNGWLKYTGTLIFDKSLPKESFSIDHTLYLILGSFKKGSSSLSDGSFLSSS